MVYKLMRKTVGKIDILSEFLYCHDKNNGVG